MLGGEFLTLSDMVAGEPQLMETPFVLQTDIGEEMGLGPDRPILHFRCALPPTQKIFGEEYVGAYSKPPLLRMA